VITILRKGFIKMSKAIKGMTASARTAKRTGIEISRYGAVRVDADQLVKSHGVKEQVAALRRLVDSGRLIKR
jgi:hypothetical protein